MTETRRSTRVLARIPLSLTVGQDPPVHGLTAAVSRHGALVMSPVRYAQGSILTAQNELTSEATSCRVTWVGLEDPSGIHSLGVEFVDEAPTFWGSTYEERLTLLPKREGP